METSTMTSIADNDPHEESFGGSSCSVPNASTKMRSKRRPTRHQATLAAYLAAGHHLVLDENRARRGLDPYRAKPLRQVAAETSMDKTTVRYWLEREHRSAMSQWWPSFDELCAELPPPSLGLTLDLPEPDADAMAADAEGYC